MKAVRIFGTKITSLTLEQKLLLYLAVFVACFWFVVPVILLHWLNVTYLEVPVQEYFKEKSRQ
jgi:hypothetical protein